MDRPTKITVTKIDTNNYKIVCTDEMSGSQTGMNIPLNGYKALAEHFRTGVDEVSSDEIGNYNKKHVSNSSWLVTIECGEDTTDWKITAPNALAAKITASANYSRKRFNILRCVECDC